MAGLNGAEETSLPILLFGQAAVNDARARCRRLALRAASAVNRPTQAPKISQYAWVHFLWLPHLSFAASSADDGVTTMLDGEEPSWHGNL